MKITTVLKEEKKKKEKNSMFVGINNLDIGTFNKHFEDSASKAEDTPASGESVESANASSECVGGEGGGMGESLTEAKRYVRRYYIRPQNIFCSNKSEILKALIELDDQNCSVYTLNNLVDNNDVTKLTQKDIIYYYDDGKLYDKNHVKVMDYDLAIKHEEERDSIDVDKVSDATFDNVYDDRMTDQTDLDEATNMLGQEVSDFDAYGYRIHNVPEYAKTKKFLVARYSEDYEDLWFYGAWDNEEDAMRVALEIPRGKFIKNTNIVECANSASTQALSEDAEADGAGIDDAEIKKYIPSKHVFSFMRNALIDYSLHGERCKKFSNPKNILTLCFDKYDCFQYLLIAILFSWNDAKKVLLDACATNYNISAAAVKQLLNAILTSTYMQYINEMLRQYSPHQQQTAECVDAKMLDEDMMHAGKLKRDVELPQGITTLSKDEVERVVDTLEPEELFTVGYITPLYFYKELWDYLPMFKCTEMTGYTGIDFSRSKDTKNNSDEMRRVNDAKLQIATSKLSGKTIYVGADTKYASQNKLVHQNDAYDDSGARINRNTLLFYPEGAPKTCYFIKLPGNDRFLKVDTKMIRDYIYKNLAKIEASTTDKTGKKTTKKTQWYNTFGIGVIGVDQSTIAGKEFDTRYINKYEVDKPQVRSLYTSQIYFIGTSDNTYGTRIECFNESLDTKKSTNLHESDENKDICCICGEEFTGYGNNAEPYAHGRCCDACNMHFVIPARLQQLNLSKNNKED